VFLTVIRIEISNLFYDKFMKKTSGKILSCCVTDTQKCERNVLLARQRNRCVHYIACLKLANIILMYCTVADVHSDEVCQMETFHAACESDRVILVESAQLGRLKIGIISCVLNIFSSSQSDLSDS